MDQPITDPISGPSFDFTFTIGPELDNLSEDLKTQTQCHHTVSPNAKLSCGQSDLDVGLGSLYLFNEMHMLKTQVEKK